MTIFRKKLFAKLVKENSCGIVIIAKKKTRLETDENLVKGWLTVIKKWLSLGYESTQVLCILLVQIVALFFAKKKKNLNVNTHLRCILYHLLRYTTH